MDRYLSALNKSKSTHRIIEQIKCEQIAQFYFIVGLMLNINDASETVDSDEFAKNKTKLVTMTCFLKSSLISKPNSFDSEKENEAEFDVNLERDLLKLMQRESALRYSIVGNWILFVSNKCFNEDQLELFEQISEFSAQNDVGVYPLSIYIVKIFHFNFVLCTCLNKGKNIDCSIVESTTHNRFIYRTS